MTSGATADRRRNREGNKERHSTHHRLSRHSVDKMMKTQLLFIEHFHSSPACSDWLFIRGNDRLKNYVVLRVLTSFRLPLVLYLSRSVVPKLREVRELKFHEIKRLKQPSASFLPSPSVLFESIATERSWGWFYRRPTQWHNRNCPLHSRRQRNNDDATIIWSSIGFPWYSSRLTDSLWPSPLHRFSLHAPQSTNGHFTIPISL